MRKPRVIFLNGTSSAGKSSIASALLAMLPDPYVCLSFDNFISLKRSAGYLDARAFMLSTYEAEDGPRATMTIGALGAKFFSGVHRAVAAFADAGNNLILDWVLWDPSWLRDFVALLRGYEVIFVGVCCPLIIAEERERARGDRLLGLARSQFTAVHAHALYDLTVDTAEADPRQCADQIARFVEAGKPATAFRVLRERAFSS